MKRSNQNVPHFGAHFASHTLTPSAGNCLSQKYCSITYRNIDSAVAVIGAVAVILQLFPSYVTIKRGLGCGLKMDALKMGEDQ